MSDTAVPQPELGLVFSQQQQFKNLLAQNILLERKLWLSRLLDPRRDIDAECGYPDVLTVLDYERLYQRGDIAKRVVDIWPEECWAERCEIYEQETPEKTDFEAAWQAMEHKFKFNKSFQHIDKLSGIGRFGVILLGIDDGKRLDQPVDGIDETGKRVGNVKHNLLYTREFGEYYAQAMALEQNPSNPRFGLPIKYRIGFQNVAIASSVTSYMEVHWHRIIHVYDNRIESLLYGIPRMEPVINRLLDVRKVVGGSAEMFWKGGFPGISLETQPNLVMNNAIEIDTKSAKDQMDAYMNGLQRYLATVGLSAKSLSVEVANPQPHLDVQLQLIAATLSVPWRIFVGSEVAQLASTQDMVSWLRRVNRRRREYIAPEIIMPLIERLVLMGILPEPKQVVVGWPDLFTPSLSDRADAAQKKAQAIAQYVTSGANAIMTPFDFFVEVLGIPDNQAKAMLDNSTEDLEKIIGDGNNEDFDVEHAGGAEGSDQDEGDENLDDEMLGAEGNIAQGGGGGVSGYRHRFNDTKPRSGAYVGKL